MMPAKLNAQEEASQEGPDSLAVYAEELQRAAAREKRQRYPKDAAFHLKLSRLCHTALSQR
jgi:hypothetical protein